MHSDGCLWTCKCAAMAVSSAALEHDLYRSIADAGPPCVQGTAAACTLAAPAPSTAAPGFTNSSSPDDLWASLGFTESEPQALQLAGGYNTFKETQVRTRSHTVSGQPVAEGHTGDTASHTGSAPVDTAVPELCLDPADRRASQSRIAPVQLTTGQQLIPSQLVHPSTSARRQVDSDTSNTTGASASSVQSSIQNAAEQSSAYWARAAQRTYPWSASKRLRVDDVDGGDSGIDESGLPEAAVQRSRSKRPLAAAAAAACVQEGRYAAVFATPSGALCHNVQAATQMQQQNVSSQRVLAACIMTVEQQPSVPICRKRSCGRAAVTCTSHRRGMHAQPQRERAPPPRLPVRHS